MCCSPSISLLLYSEDSKQDSDLDEPWIMTVKGMNFNNFNKNVMEDPLGSPVKHNGTSNIGVSSNRDRDYNLNQQKSSQVGGNEPSNERGQNRESVRFNRSAA